MRLTAAASATDAAINRKMFGSDTTALIICNGEMNDFMKIMKSLEESGLLIKSVKIKLRWKSYIDLFYIENYRKNISFYYFQLCANYYFYVQEWRWKNILTRRVNWDTKNPWFNWKSIITLKIWVKNLD